MGPDEDDDDDEFNGEVKDSIEFIGARDSSVQRVGSGRDAEEDDDDVTGTELDEEELGF